MGKAGCSAFIHVNCVQLSGERRLKTLRDSTFCKVSAIFGLDRGVAQGGRPILDVFDRQRLPLERGKEDGTKTEKAE